MPTEDMSFIDSPFTSKVEYERYVAGEIPLPTAAADISDAGLVAATAGMSVDSSQAWGPLEYPPARRAALQQKFVELAGGASNRLSLKKVHALIFEAEERAEYGFDNFDEDLQATVAGCGDDMGWDDVIKFMDENL